MGNCLKTQLKENVSNDSLTKFGAIRAKIRTSASSTSIQHQIGTSEQIKMTILNGALFNTATNGTISEDEKTLTTTNSNCVFTLKSITGDYMDVEITPKYKITRFSNFVDFDIEELKYINGLLYFNTFEGAKGDLKSLVTYCPELIEARFFTTINNPPIVTGKFSDLAEATNISYIELFNCSEMTEDSIESFVAIRVKNGNTSSTGNGVRLRGQNYKIKFVEQTIATEISGKYITWAESGNNTIITYGETTTTIHVNSNGTWTRVS